MKIREMLTRFWRDEDGGESVEWPLIIGLIAVVAIAAYTSTGTKVNSIMNKISTTVGSA